MRNLYFDCSSGIAGDMAVAALLEILGHEIGAAAAFTALKTALAALPYDGYELRLETVNRSSIACKRFVVEVTKPQPERHFTSIRDAIDGSSLPQPVRHRAISLFLRLGQVEAKLHGVCLDEVHFHEVGAVDSIVDVVSFAWLLDRLAIDELSAGSIQAGRGMIRTSHGLLPIPAPATLELLRGAPLDSPKAEGELITPTGALFLSQCSRFGSIPPGIIRQTGYGAGTHLYEGVPGFLRACLVATETNHRETDVVEVLETFLDDMPAEAFEPLAQELWQAGAVDVVFAPCFMKKHRPAVSVTVIVPLDRSEKALEALFRCSTTIGVRRRTSSRALLPRKAVVLETEYGEIQAKAVKVGDKTRVQPEYEACLKRARKLNLPYLEVYRAALVRAHGLQGMDWSGSSSTTLRDEGIHAKRDKG